MFMGETQSYDKAMSPVYSDTMGFGILAKQIYEEGYDVWLYDEDAVYWAFPRPGVAGEPYGPAFFELRQGLLNQEGFVNICVLGYSHGGGGTYKLTKYIVDEFDTEKLLDPTEVILTIPFTLYLDAVTLKNACKEDHRPFDDDPPWPYHQHTNYWQINPDCSLLHPSAEFGGGIMNYLLLPQDEQFNVNVQPWGRQLNHGSIDDDITVRSMMLYRFLDAEIPR
jgi:hypothetical protein